MQLKNLGNSISAIKDIQNVITTMSKFKGLGAQNETIRQLKESTKAYSTEVLKLAIAKTTLDETQIKEILSAKGLKGEILETTTAELVAATSTNVLSASEEVATGTTVGLSTAFKGLAASLGISTTMLAGLIAGAAAIGVGLIALKKYEQHLEEVRQATDEAAKTYEESSSSIDDYVSRYNELQNALTKAKGNEEETYNAKKQLLDLQTELNSKFGEEYGSLNLVTDAYKDQTEAIKEYNAESAKKFLNENQEGIKLAEKELKRDRVYKLGSLKGLSNVTDEERELLEKIRNIAKSNNIDYTYDYTYEGFKFIGSADEASDSINNFINDIKLLQKESGSVSEQMSGIFDNITTSSGKSLKNANEIIDEYGNIFDQARMANIASDETLSKQYKQIESAVKNYNEAVLKSENPYQDKNVNSTWNHLQDVKKDIEENKSDWEQYSDIIDDVFSSVNDKVYSFYQTLRKDDSISKLYNKLKGLSDIDLQSMANDGNNGDIFDKLYEKAKKYGLEIEDLTDLLLKLGIVQQTTFENDKTISKSSRFQSLWDSEDFEKTREELEKLSKEAGITENDIRSLSRENSSLASVLDSTGISAQFAASCFQRVCDGADGFSAITDDALALDQVLHEMDGKLQEVTASKEKYDKALEGKDYNSDFLDYQEDYKEAMEMFENGDYGKHFRAAMERFLGKESYTMGIEELKEAMDGLKDLFGENATNGLEFLERLYEKRDQLEGMKSSITKEDGKYQFHFDTDEYEKIGEITGTTAEQVAALSHAIGMFGDYASYDIDKLNQKLQEMDIAVKDGADSILSLQTVESMLSEQGYDDYSIFKIMEDMQGLEGIKLIDFGKDDEASIKSIISYLEELNMIEIDGKNINVDGLVSNLSDSLRMSEEQISSFITNLSKDYKFTDTEGSVLSLDKALEKVQEKKNGSIPAEMDEAKEHIESADEKAKEFSNTLDEFNKKSFAPLRSELGQITSTISGIITNAGLLQTILGKFSTSLTASGLEPYTGHVSKPGQEKNQTGAVKALGDPGIKKDETALINELGEETIIDPKKGTYEIVHGGAQFRKLKKGQIILNHLQTKSLLKNGEISSFGKMLFRGTADLKGNAYNSGTAGTINSATKKPWNSTKKKKSGNNSTGNNSNRDNSLDNAKESIEVFDFIEIAISRIEEAIDRLKTKAEETFQTFTFRGKEYKKTISKITEEIRLQEKAYNAYLARANSVGLEEGWASQVRNGKVNIADIADDGLKERIKDYQKWYEKALACQKSLEELKKTQQELMRERIELYITRYDKMLSKLESYNSRINNKINLKETWGGFSSKNDYKKLNDNIRDQLFYRVQEIRRLKELQKTVEKGSEAWYEYQGRIDSNKESMQELTKSMAENAIASASLAGQKAEKKNSEKDKQDEKLDMQIASAASASTKNSMISQKSKNVRHRQENLQSAYDSTRKDRNYYGKKIKKADNKHVSSKYKKLFKDAIKSVKSGKLVSESTISKIINALEVTTGKEYHELRNLLTYCNYYNANKQAEEEAQMNLEMYALTAQAEKKELREERLQNNLDENQKKADRSTISNDETVDAKNHNINVQSRQNKANVSAETKARKDAVNERKKAASKTKFYTQSTYKKLKDKKLKKRLEKAVSAIKAGKRIPDDSLKAVQEYCKKYLNNNMTYYDNCRSYNEAVENELSAKESETLAKAESYAYELQSKREKAENIVSGRNAENEYYSATAKNQTSAKGKNKYIDKQIANTIKNNQTYDNAYQTSVNDYNSSKKKVNQFSSKNKIVKNIKEKYIKKNILIPAKEIENAYKVSDAFGLACENYNEALNAMQAAKETKELNDETAKTEIAALALEKMSNIDKEYSNKQASYDQKEKRIQNSMDMAQAKGYQIGTKFYDSLIQNEENINGNLQKKRNDMLSSLEESLKNGSITKYSDEWYEALANIDSVTDALDESTLSLAELQKQLQQLKWDNFDYLESRIRSVISESNFMINELSRKKLASDKIGWLTEEGKSANYLHAANYKFYLEQAKDYNDEITRINKELASDPYNKTLLERRDELVKSYQDSIKGAQDEKYAIIDLYKQGYEALANKIHNLINEYEELLDAEKDAYDYQNTIADKTKEIANLKKQLTAYAGDTSEETKAKLQSLTVSLEKAEKDLQETQYNKYISDTKDMLSDMQNSFTETIQELIDSLDEKFKKLIGDIDNNTSESVKTITEKMKGIGYTPTEDFEKLFTDKTFEKTTLEKTVKDIKTGIDDLCKSIETVANSTAEEPKPAIDEPKANTEPTKNNNTSSGTATPSVSNSGKTETTIATITNEKVGTKPLKAMATIYLDSNLKSTKTKRSELSDLNKKLYDNFGKKILNTNQMKELAKMLGIKYDNQKSSGTLYKKLKSIGIKGFKIGSQNIPYNQFAFLGEGVDELRFDKSQGVLQKVGQGDMIFTNEMTKRLWEISQMDSNELLKKFSLTPTTVTHTTAIPNMVQNADNHYGDMTLAINELTLPNVTNYKEFRDELLRDKVVERGMQSMITEPLRKGGNSLNKYKYTK